MFGRDKTRLTGSLEIFSLQSSKRTSTALPRVGTCCKSFSLRGFAIGSGGLRRLLPWYPICHRPRHTHPSLHPTLPRKNE